MRILELFLVVLLTVECVKHFWPRVVRFGFLSHLPRVLTFVFVLHAVLEGVRWQLFPVYGLTITAFVLNEAILAKTPIAGIFHRGALGRGLALAGAAVSLLLIAASVFIARGFPVFSYPKPTGPEAVGYRVYTLVDETRPETLSPDGGPRAFAVHVWYPAQPEPGATPKPFMTKAEAKAAIKAKGYTLGDDKGRLGFIGDHMPLIDTYSYVEAPVAQGGPRPVLVYSHGYMPGDALDAQTLMEDLASHGYVVVSVSHPYESGVTYFKDREFVYGDRTHTDKVNTELYAIINDTLITPPSTPRHERIALQRKLEEGTPLFGEVIRRWAADTAFALDEVERWAKDGDHPLSSIIDPENIGVFGLSNGGAVATRFCAVDARCKAGVNFDGFAFGTADTPPQAPFMMMYSDTPGNFGMNDFVFEGMSDDLYTVIIENSRHADFTTTPFTAPILKGSPIVGTIGGSDMHKVTAAYTRAFFDEYLKDIPAPELRNVSRTLFPHARFRFAPGALVPTDAPGVESIQTGALE
ncbi:MAG: hypothetical protein AAGC95_17445 [Pseudomonadota bacterium]